MHNDIIQRMARSHAALDAASSGNAAADEWRSIQK